MIEMLKKALRAQPKEPAELTDARRLKTIESANKAIFAQAAGGDAAGFDAALERALASGLSLADLRSVAGSPMEAACSAAEGGARMIESMLRRGEPARGIVVVSREGCVEPLEICFRRGRWGSAGYLLSRLRESKTERPVGAEALRWAMDGLGSMARHGKRTPSAKEIGRMLGHFEGLDPADSQEGLAGFKPKQARLLWRAAPCEAALEALLALGAEIDERVDFDPADPGSEGETALFKASVLLSEGSVELLLAAGADPRATNAKGETAARALGDFMASRSSASPGGSLAWRMIEAEQEAIARRLIERLEQAERAFERASRAPRRILSRGR